MKVVNVHQRLLRASPERVGALLETLGSPASAVFGRGGRWPRMKLDRPLGLGAAGGHGPICYFVDGYTPGQWVRFRFTVPLGFDGHHAFEVLEATPQHCVLEHRIEMDARGVGLLKWIFFIRPLHDACVEDVLSQAEASLGETPRQMPWLPYVRLLMWLTALRPPCMRSGRASHAS